MKVLIGNVLSDTTTTASYNVSKWHSLAYLINKLKIITATWTPWRR